MRLDLDIEAHDRQLGFEIAGVNGTLASGTWVEVPGSAKLQFCDAIIRKAVKYSGNTAIRLGCHEGH